MQQHAAQSNAAAEAAAVPPWPETLVEDAAPDIRLESRLGISPSRASAFAAAMTDSRADAA